ncbi:stage II sporulation protein M [Labilibaculum sp.]|uniref:stage II sporulation protein M n=1 Tax=Labilibaculum sp. TaxID=2060723 RepID=UPI002AA681EE|nr:stage II sporulation protein M [Labilibaculum sp.]MBN2596395.1 stage II sporulation protein M [Marinifilaceae bacterium]
MKANKLKPLALCLSLFSIGIIIGELLSTPVDSQTIQTPKTLIEIQSFNFEAFFNILSNNLLVAFCLSILGYLTGGIMSCLVLIWNGVIIGLITPKNLNTGNFFNFIEYFIYHGVIEILAFFLFAIIGMKGFYFYKKLMTYQSLPSLPHWKEFTLPLSFLIIAAVIESYLIQNYTP